MKHNRLRFQGFLAGLLTAVVGLGLGGAVLAAVRTIQIDDGIAVTINGASFTPRDVKGAEVPLFTYNGTTYAPVRALTVNYDSASRTAQITTGDRALVSDPNASGYITADWANEIALAHAGIDAADAVFLVTKLDWDNGRTLYDVEFYCGSTEYDYDVDALTGVILKWDVDYD